MQEYDEIIKEVISDGNFKRNRTDVATISKFGVDYTIDTDRYPLLTSKKMDGFRWDSMIHELFWYLSGEEHIRNLQEETSIWNKWADEDGNLDTAYGRFWRRYPIPDVYGELRGETWPSYTNEHTQTESDCSWNPSRRTFDQIGHVIDQLKENPNSRRHVVSAWHPANAAESTLPQCHYTFVFNVQNGNELNLHLTQRSGDVAIGIPFNIASYALLQRMIAQEVGMQVGKFHHSIVDAHIYCGKGDRADWWEKNWEQVREDNFSPMMRATNLCRKNPHDDPENYDHIPGLLEQFSRENHELPRIEIADKPFDDLEYEDIELKDYKSHPGIEFGIAE